MGDAAIEHVRECVRRPDRAKSRQVGATAALEDSIRRARSRMLIFDAQIPLIFRDDADALGHWEVMKRVHRLPSYSGGDAGGGDAGGEDAASMEGITAVAAPPMLALLRRVA